MCVCQMAIEEPIQADTYWLELWSERRQLWQGSFKPSDNGKARLGAAVREVGHTLTAGQLLLCPVP